MHLALCLCTYTDTQPFSHSPEDVGSQFSTATTTHPRSRATPNEKLINSFLAFACPSAGHNLRAPCAHSLPPCIPTTLDDTGTRRGHGQPSGPAVIAPTTTSPAACDHHECFAIRHSQQQQREPASSPTSSRCSRHGVRQQPRTNTTTARGRGRSDPAADRHEEDGKFSRHSGVGVASVLGRRPRPSAATPQVLFLWREFKQPQQHYQQQQQ